MTCNEYQVRGQSRINESMYFASDLAARDDTG